MFIRSPPLRSGRRGTPHSSHPDACSSVSRVLTDRGTEFCGKPEAHENELYLAIENIGHRRTKVKSPQTNGICERFHKTLLDEFYRVAFRKKLYRTAARSRCLARGVQRAAPASRALVLRQDTDADLH